MQERQQSLSLMERLNSEKRTRQQLEEEVFKLQVNYLRDIGLGLAMITEPPISGLRLRDQSRTLQNTKDELKYHRYSNRLLQGGFGRFWGIGWGQGHGFKKVRF